jgi:hypothetical protein
MIMSGSFLPSPWSSTNHSLLGSKEPALLCNHMVLGGFHLSGFGVNQAQPLTGSVEFFSLSENQELPCRIDGKVDRNPL